MAVSNLSQSSSFEDILFQGRNKRYGAYSIRQNYNRSVAKGFLIALCLFSILFFLHHTSGKIILPPIGIPGTIIVSGPPIIQLPKTITHPPTVHREEIKSPAHIRFSTKEDVFVRTDKSPVPLVNVPETSEGDIPVAGSADGDFHFHEVQPIPPPNNNPIPWTEVSNLPKFPGGERAMFKFIQDNMHFPEIARQTGGEGIVYISFVVSDAGKVSDINVVKKAGFGFDEESIRVIGLMPNWVPGEQNGKKVNVRMIIPVKFTLR